MLILKEVPSGIDIQIGKLAKLVHDGLVKAWGVDVTYKAYGRCYRNKTEDGYIAENYEGKGEYKEVYWDDSLAAISFFGLSGRQVVQSGNELDVHLVFFVNLAKVKPLITHRADDEVRKDVQNLVGGMGSFGHKLDSIELSLENVLKEYPGSRRDDRLKYVDMHPVHCFRFNFSYRYNINNC